MIRRHPRSTRTNQLFPYTALFRSCENAGNARIKGFEVETIFAPSRVFRVSASAGYIDAYYRRINDPPGTITLASRLPRVPKWTATLSPEFNLSLPNEGRVTLRAD